MAHKMGEEGKGRSILQGSYFNSYYYIPLTHFFHVSHFAAGGYTFSQPVCRSSSVLLAIEEESDWIPIFEMDMPPGKVIN